MKVHTGVDAGTGYVHHTITGTAANVHDVAETSTLIRKDAHVVYGDSGYLDAPERPKKRKSQFQECRFQAQQPPLPV